MEKPNKKPKQRSGGGGGGRQRPDIWELRAYLGRDETGRVRHRYARFRGTKREADRVIKEEAVDPTASTSAWLARVAIDDLEALENPNRPLLISAGSVVATLRRACWRRCIRNR